jgi:hypothetical protein
MRLAGEVSRVGGQKKQTKKADKRADKSEGRNKKAGNKKAEKRKNRTENVKLLPARRVAGVFCITSALQAALQPSHNT